MTAEGPRVGPACESSTRCGYSATPNSPGCTDQATVHVQVTRPDGEPVALATCGGHEDVARAAGTVIAEHAFAHGYCSHPDGEWLNDGSACVMPISAVHP